MFIVITPPEHDRYKRLIKPFLDHIKNNSQLKWSFQNHKNATFIITADKLNGIYGGAILLKETNTALQKSLQKNLLNRKCHDEIWLCSIFLHRDNKCSSKSSEFFYETFYRDLYKKLIKFGVKENTHFLYTMLEAGEYFCTEALGDWSYIFKTKSHDSLSSLYHGILSLANNPTHFHVESDVTMEFQEIKLAA